MRDEVGTTGGHMSESPHVSRKRSVRTLHDERKETPESGDRKKRVSRGPFNINKKRE